MLQSVYSFQYLARHPQNQTDIWSRLEKSNLFEFRITKIGMPNVATLRDKCLKDDNIMINLNVYSIINIQRVEQSIYLVFKIKKIKKKTVDFFARRKVKNIL